MYLHFKFAKIHPVVLARSQDVLQKKKRKKKSIKSTILNLENKNILEILFLHRPYILHKLNFRKLPLIATEI